MSVRGHLDPGYLLLSARARASRTSEQALLDRTAGEFECVRMGEQVLAIALVR